MSTQQNITPERKLKGIYLNSPQANTATLPAKQPFQLTNVNSAKFFKARKNSHSKRRAGENESLYEESMKLKIQTNNLKEENLRLKTQIQVTEKELEKRDQLVEEVTLSLNSNMKCSECSLKNPASPVKHKKMLAILKSSLTNNLKKQVKDLRSEVSDLKKEKMDMKNTKVTELNIELNVMKDEWLRLRNILEENFKSKAGKEQQQEAKALKSGLQERDVFIDTMRSDNMALAQAWSIKDEEITKLTNSVADFKSKYDKQKKLINSLKKTKKLIRDKDREILRIKSENIDFDEKASKIKEDQFKKLKEKDHEILKLKAQLERSKTKINKSSLKTEKRRETHSSRPRSNPASLRDNSSEKKLKSKVSDKASSHNSEAYEVQVKKTSAHGTPKQSSPKKVAALPRTKKNIKELKNAILQLQCKMNDYNTDSDGLVDKLLPSDNMPIANFLQKLKDFMAYSLPDEVEDLANTLAHNNKTVTKKMVKSFFKNEAKLKKFDRSTGINFVNIYR